MQAGKEEKCGQVGWWSRQGMQSHREFKVGRQAGRVRHGKGQVNSGSQAGRAG